MHKHNSKLLHHFEAAIGAYRRCRKKYETILGDPGAVREEINRAKIEASKVSSKAGKFFSPYL